MRTPRELLLARHRAAEPKLDAVRQEVLADLPGAPAKEGVPDRDPGGIRATFRELLFPVRWHLAAMSGAWLLIGFLNLDRPSSQEPTIAKETTASPRQLLTALRENRRQLMQLLESPANLSESEPAAPAFVPKRRGELRISTAMA